MDPCRTKWVAIMHIMFDIGTYSVAYVVLVPVLSTYCMGSSYCASLLLLLCEEDGLKPCLLFSIHIHGVECRVVGYRYRYRTVPYHTVLYEHVPGSRVLSYRRTAPYVLPHLYSIRSLAVSSLSHYVPVLQQNRSCILRHFFPRRPAAILVFGNPTHLIDHSPSLTTTLRFFAFHSKGIYPVLQHTKQEMHVLSTTRLLTPFVISTSNRFLAVLTRQNTALASTKRWYRGDSGDMKTRVETIGHHDAISEREAQLLQISQPRYKAIYEKHIQLPTIDGISPHALYGDEEKSMSTNKEEQELNVRRKRLIYRSKQRGWLEVDLLLGTWANKFVPTLSIEELDEFERFVNLETVGTFVKQSPD